MRRQKLTIHFLFILINIILFFSNCSIFEPERTYFAIDVGNQWTYESYNYVGEGNSWTWIGTEVWEILEIDLDDHTFNLKIDFEGIKVVFDPYNSGRRDTTDVEYSRTIQLSYDDEYIKYDSTLTTSDTPSGFTYEEVAGLNIISGRFDIPYVINSREHTIHIEKYYFSDHDQFYWDMRLNTGIAKAEYNVSDGFSSYQRKIELISTNF